MRAGSRTPLPLLGASVGAAVIAVAALVSLILYLAFSETVRLAGENWGYLQFVTASLLSEPSARVFSGDATLSVPGLVALLTFVASCVGVGMLVGRVWQGHPAAAPMAWIAALGASVVPTLAIATVRWPDGGGSINNVTILAAQLLLLIAVWWWSRRTQRPAEGDTPIASETAPDTLSLWLRLGFALSVAFALTVLLSGSTGIFGYDSFSNHLADPARWLHAERLARGLPEEFVSFYPGNFELLVRWTLALGTDRFAFLLAFGSNIAALWVLHRIARELGQSRTAAAMVALGAASLQALAYQGVIVYSDSFTALCLLLATWLLLVWVRDGATDDRLTFGLGLAFGVALGAKYSAGPPVVVLGLAWLWHAWRASGRSGDYFENPTSWSTFARRGVALWLGVLPAMGYWYLRNTVEQGNPLFPLSVAGLPGYNINDLLNNAPGPKTLLERLTWPWTEVGHIAGYETGLGPVFAAVVVVAVCAFPVYRHLALRTVSSEGIRRAPVGLLWVVLIGAWLAWLQTGVLVPRYGFFPLLLSFVFVGELWMAYASGLLAVVFGVAVSATMITVGHEMVGGAAYNELFFAPGPPVPAVIDSLAPARILNAAGQPSGYYARGRDGRHEVINLFTGVRVDDVRRLAPDYLLLPRAREPEFVDSLPLELVGRWRKDGQAPTALWRLVK